MVVVAGAASAVLFISRAMTGVAPAARMAIGYSRNPCALEHALAELDLWLAKIAAVGIPVDADLVDLATQA